MWNARKKERVTKTNEEGKRENKETEKKRGQELGMQRKTRE